MARKIPRDTLILDWTMNPSIQFNQSFSVLRNGYWYAPLKCAITQNRRVCLQAHGFFAAKKYDDAFGSAMLLSGLDHPGGLLENGVLFTGNGNHWHYLIDGLANLTVDMFDNYDILYVDSELSEDQLSFLKAYIQLLTSKDIKIQIVSGDIFALCNVCVPINDMANSKISRLRQKLANINTGLGALGQSIVYVSRKNSRNRRVINESDLIEELQKKWDVVPLLNEEMSLMRQLQCYRDAQIVIGPHGAGLTNLVFATDPRLLIELYCPPHQIFFEGLAATIAAQYHSIQCQPTSPDSDLVRKDDNDFIAPLSKVLSAMQAYS